MKIEHHTFRHCVPGLEFNDIEVRRPVIWNIDLDRRIRESIISVSRKLFGMEKNVILHVTKHNPCDAIKEDRDLEPPGENFPLHSLIPQILRMSRIKLWYSGKLGRLLWLPPIIRIRVIF